MAGSNAMLTNWPAAKVIITYPRSKTIKAIPENKSILELLIAYIRCSSITCNSTSPVLIVISSATARNSQEIENKYSSKDKAEKAQPITHSQIRRTMS